MSSDASSAVEPRAAVASARRPRRVRVFAEHPGKRATERVWLWYTPVWGSAAAIVMMGGLANHWGDWELTLFSLVLGVGAVVAPILLRPEEERALPWFRSTAFKMGMSVTGFALLLNYSQTAFFFDVLHMHYGFDTTWNVRQTPVGLYLLTIAYFSTYAVLCMMAYRMARSLVVGASPWIKWPVVAMAPFGVAFLETALNANPFMSHLFCYDDIGFALSFGTLAYGTAFCFALPAWMSIDERPGASVGMRVIVVGFLAAVYAQLLVLDVLRYHVAPHFTEVQHGAVGFRDFDTSCLEPLPGSR